MSEDTTIQEDELTAHDESENDARDSLPRELSSKAHDSGRKDENSKQRLMPFTT